MGARDGIMLSTKEIEELDWSVFDGIDMSKISPERLDAVHKISLQIEKLRLNTNI
jgi:hypothetical protein